MLEHGRVRYHADMADPAVPIVLIVFGMPVAIVGVASYFRYKMAQLRDKQGEDPKQLEKEREERKQLEARVQNLESIVCSVDLELNARINRMLAAQSAIGALPPHVRRQGGDRQRPWRSDARLACWRWRCTPGQKIADRYTIERELGRGGMGAVYLAADEQAGRARGAQDHQRRLRRPGGAVDRFRREVAAARKVTHPNVIRIHDLVEDGGMVLLSMEYVEGMTLAAVPRPRRRAARRRGALTHRPDLRRRGGGARGRRRAPRSEAGQRAPRPREARQGDRLRAGQGDLHGTA